MYTKVKSDNRKRVGELGERFARQFVERSLGWKILAQNWRCRIGEIDLIAVDCATLVVIEVRTRQSTHFGSALDSVVHKKCRQLRRLTAYYLNQVQAQESLHELSTRIDVIGLQMQREQIVDLVHVKNAVDTHD